MTTSEALRQFAPVLTQAADQIDGLTAQHDGDAAALTAATQAIADQAVLIADLRRQLEEKPAPSTVPSDGSPIIVVTDRPASTVFFDTYFKGDTLNAKMQALNAWMPERQKTAGPIPPVMFDSKTYPFSVPIEQYSGFTFLTPNPTPVREFSRRTVLKWQGGKGTSMFAWPTKPQSGQSYPGDGSPRDTNWLAVQFEGPAGTHFMPLGDRGNYKGKTLWYFTVHNCSWKSFDTVYRGAVTGLTISGISHFQGLGDEPLVLGGSEAGLFVGGYAFVDSKRMSPGVAFVRSSLSKSQIGLVMFTGRQDLVPVVLDGGEATRLDGTRIDAQDSDPINGAGLRITGGAGHIISAGLKGVGAKAGAARGWIEITGGSEHLIERSAFLRKGTSPAAVTLPVVYVGGTAERVKVGLNTFPGWPAGSRPVVQQTRAGRVVACTDPTVDLLTAA